MCSSASGFFIVETSTRCSNLQSIRESVAQHVANCRRSNGKSAGDRSPYENRDFVDQDRADFLRSKDDLELSLYDARTMMTMTPCWLRKCDTREEKEEKERRNSMRVSRKRARESSAARETRRYGERGALVMRYTSGFAAQDSRASHANRELVRIVNRATVI